MSANSSSTASEVTAILESVERYSRRFAEPAEPYVGTECKDIITAHSMCCEAPPPPSHRCSVTLGQ